MRTLLLALALAVPLHADEVDPSRATVIALRDAARRGARGAILAALTPRAARQLAAAGWLRPAAADAPGTFAYVLEADRARLPRGAGRRAALARLQAALVVRLRRAGYRGLSASIEGARRVTIVLTRATPTAARRAGALMLDRRTIELRLVAADETAQRARPPQEGAVHPPAPDGHEWLPGAGSPRLVARRPLLTGADFERVRDEVDPVTGGRRVTFRLTPAGGERLRAATRRHTGRSLAIVFGGQVKSAPVIRGEIGREGVLVGLSADEVRALSACLRSQLPFPVRLMRVYSDRPLLAQLASLTRVHAVSQSSPTDSRVTVAGPDGLTAVRLRRAGARWRVHALERGGRPIDLEDPPRSPLGR